MATIQWFPGHMTKARRMIEQELKLVDVVIELVDARIPESSRNPLLGEIIGKKRPRLIILNKADLADPNPHTVLALKIHAGNNLAVAVISTSGRKKLQQTIVDAVYELTAAKRQRLPSTKGATSVTLRVMVVGIPQRWQEHVHQHAPWPRHDDHWQQARRDQGQAVGAPTETSSFSTRRGFSGTSSRMKRSATSWR